MKKCIVCKREILSKASICPYCSAKQEDEERTKTILWDNEEDVTVMGESFADISQRSREGTEKIPHISGESETEEIFNISEDRETEEIFDISEDKKTEMMFHTPENKGMEEVFWIPKETEKVSNIPREIIAEEVTDISNGGMREEAFNILEEEPGKMKKEENRILGEEHMENNGTRRCSHCNKIIPSRDKFCSYCGEKVEPISGSNGNWKTTEEPSNTSGNLLKYYGIVLGVIFGYFAITYLPWLGYYGFSAKLWGFLMIVACAWSAFIYFVIAFCCRRQYGKHLVCALAGGAILKLILQVIMLLQYSAFINSAALSFVAIIITILGVVLCYYLMQAEGMILTQEQKSLQQIITEIPAALRNLISQGQATSRGTSGGKRTVNSHRPVMPNTLRGQTIYFISGGLFLAFCILYTLELVYDVVLNFSYLALIMNVFCILSCVAIWLLYYGSKKNELHTTALSIITVITYIKLGLNIALVVGIIILLIVSEVDIASILVIFAILLLDIGYWYSLGATFFDAKKFSTGEKNYIKVRIYPIIVKGLRVAVQVIGFIIAAILQYFANTLTDSIHQGQQDISSSLGALFDNPILDEFGLGSEYWYDKAYSATDYFVQPIVQWIQDVLGFSKNPIFMIIAIAITVIEIILFSKMRSLMKANRS